MKDMSVFIWLILQFFSGPEVPVLRPEIPALRIFPPNFRPKVPDYVQRASQDVRVAPGGPEIPGLTPEVPARAGKTGHNGWIWWRPI